MGGEAHSGAGFPSKTLGGKGMGVAGIAAHGDRIDDLEPQGREFWRQSC